MRERVFKCLGSIGSIIQGAEDRLKIYSKVNVGLWQAAEEVYVALLSAAEIMVRWLCKSSMSTLYLPSNLMARKLY